MASFFFYLFNFFKKQSDSLLSQISLFSFLHLKYRAIQFHLFHERPNREDQTAISRKLFNKKKQEGISFCKNGITKIKS